MNARDHRVCSVIAAALAVLALATVLAGCAATPAAPRTGEGPVGTGWPHYESGFSAFCRANPGISTCPPR